MTRSRYPGNPDFTPDNIQCDECGRFVGHPVYWEKINPFDDLPTFHRALCDSHAPDLPTWGESA